MAPGLGRSSRTNEYLMNWKKGRERGPQKLVESDYSYDSYLPAYAYQL